MHRAPDLASSEGPHLQTANIALAELQRLVRELSDLRPFSESPETESLYKRQQGEAAEKQPLKRLSLEEENQAVTIAAGIKTMSAQWRGRLLHINVPATEDLGSEKSQKFLRDASVLEFDGSLTASLGNLSSLTKKSELQNLADRVLRVHTPSVFDASGSLRVPPSLLSRLCSLSLCRLGLKQLPSLAESCPLLEELFLSENLLCDEALRSVARLQRLKVLSLDANRLLFPGSRECSSKRLIEEGVGSSRGVAAGGLFGVCTLVSSLPSLEDLDVSHNKLCGLGEQLESKALRSLRCSDNSLREFLWLHPLPELRFVDACENSLELIGGLESVPRLQELRLSVLENSASGISSHLALSHPSLETLWLAPSPRRLSPKRPNSVVSVQRFSDLACQWKVPALRELRLGFPRKHSAFDVKTLLSRKPNVPDADAASGADDGVVAKEYESPQIAESTTLSPLSRLLIEGRCFALSFANSLVALCLSETRLPRDELATLLGCVWPSLELLDLRKSLLDCETLKSVKPKRRLRVLLLDDNPIGSLSEVLESVCSEKVRGASFRGGFFPFRLA